MIDNIFVKFGGCLFRWVIGIPMGTNCAPLIADFFLYSYESEFLDNMIRSGIGKLLGHSIYVTDTPSSMTNVFILISTLSIFHSFRAISHLYPFVWYLYSPADKICKVLLIL